METGQEKLSSVVESWREQRPGKDRKETASSHMATSNPSIFQGNLREEKRREGQETVTVQPLAPKQTLQFAVRSRR